MMKTVKITIGTGFNFNGFAITEEQAELNIQRSVSYITDLYGGVTVNEGEGAWKDEQGKTVIEPNVTFTVGIPLKKATIVEAEALAGSLHLFHDQHSFFVEFDGMAWLQENHYLPKQ